MMFSVDTFEINIQGKGSHGTERLHAHQQKRGKGKEKLVRRLKEVSEATAAVYGGSAEVTFICEVPTLVCDGALTKEVASYMTELSVPNAVGYSGIAASASEDFALIAERVPSAFMYLSAGYADERGDYPAHNPKVQFNEDVLPIGAACLAHSVVRWLAEHN